MLCESRIELLIHFLIDSVASVVIRNHTFDGAKLSGLNLE